MKSKIITYTNFIDDTNSLVGIQVLPDRTAKQYIKAIKLLEQNNIEFQFLDDRIPISLQDFQVNTYSSSDAKALYKYFELEVIDGSSEAVGVFPDVITLAMEERINGCR